MRRTLQSTCLGLPALLLVLVTLPFTLGQGCGGNGLLPVYPSGAPSGTQTSTGNVSPFFEFIEPASDVSVEIGTIVTIAWSDSDPDNNAAITLLADPDNVYGNGNERVILALALEDDETDSFDFDTSALPVATYRIIARVNDNVNPELIAVAPGRLILFGFGQVPGNRSPIITMTAPETNLALAQGENAQLAYCGSDADDGLDSVIPDIVILLDTNQSTTDDLNLTGPNREAVLFEACNPGPFPRMVAGVLVLGCAKDNDCAALANATQFQLTVDVSLIPPRPGGDPYFPRVTMWDHTNPPVHSYARGNISITSLGSGTIDVGQVGRTISGARFYGFDAGGLSGSTASSVGDLDGDGADDFVIVSRLGRPFEVGNVGSAHVIMGNPGVKFGSEISLNSIGTLYRGAALTMPGVPNTEGITSVCQVSDIDGDGRPEILFGMPNVTSFYDNLQDDLHHCSCPDNDQPPGCYGDLMPNPFSGEPICIDRNNPDAMQEADWREYFFCSNDLDSANDPPIVGGYAVMVSSRNDLTTLNASVVGLGAVGQSRGGGAPFGARFRGPWYFSDDFDYSQTTYPYAIVPDNRFGQTVNTMPFMTDPSLDLPPRFGDELLISSPNSYDGRGALFYVQPQDFTRFNGAGSQSIPYYEALFECPSPGRARVYPGFHHVKGAAPGDQLGYAAAAGDYNLDGNRDILLGAPGAERNGIPQIGIVYVLFGRPDFPDVLDFQAVNPPRMEIRGVNTGDQFGFMQTIVGDVNQDGLPDIGFSSQFADGPGGADSGFIGVIFGGRRLTGENIFTVNQVGTSQLPGFKLYGTQPGGHAGAIINNAGDFNGDGTDDLLVCAPDEFRSVDGQSRRGVGYVIFGGPHLANGTFFTNQVGTPQLPGVVLVSPYIVGSAEEAPIDFIGTAGDVNGDGFSDVIVGVSRADFVNPLEPTQRRIDAGEAYLVYGNNTGTNRISN